MGGTASANRDRSDRVTARDKNSATATNPSFKTEAPTAAPKPTEADGARAQSKMGILGRIGNDLSMGLGFTEKDESYEMRTAATRAREAEKNRSKIGDIGYESRTDQRANSKSIIAKPAPAPVTAAETETETVDVKTAPPDPDTLPVGEAEAEVVKTVPKLGKKSTIATSNQGLETNSGQGLLRKKRSLMGMIK